MLKPAVAFTATMSLAVLAACIPEPPPPPIVPGQVPVGGVQAAKPLPREGAAPSEGIGDSSLVPTDGTGFSVSLEGQDSSARTPLPAAKIEILTREQAQTFRSFGSLPEDVVLATEVGVAPDDWERLPTGMFLPHQSRFYKLAFPRGTVPARVSNLYYKDRKIVLVTWMPGVDSKLAVPVMPAGNILSPEPADGTGVSARLFGSDPQTRYPLAGAKIATLTREQAKALLMGGPVNEDMVLASEWDAEQLENWEKLQDGWHLPHSATFYRLTFPIGSIQKYFPPGFAELYYQDRLVRLVTFIPGRTPGPAVYPNPL